MRLPDRLRLPLAFDPASLAADLGRVTETWIPHFVPANYEGDWSVIALRFPAGARHPVTRIFSDPTASSYVDAPLLGACPAFRAALAALACPLLAVRLMRLGPGSAIKEHVDPDLDAEQGMVRLHLPVRTHRDVDFQLNRRRVVMEAGSLWYLRLTDPHSVANRGDTERVHLVIDASVNPWLAGLLAAAVSEQTA